MKTKLVKPAHKPLNDVTDLHINNSGHGGGGTELGAISVASNNASV